MFNYKTTLVFPLFLNLFFTAVGQEAVTKDSAEDHVLENIHLHLNKTAFLKGENLWFKAYIQDQNRRMPSKNTRNLHVGLFSKDGKILSIKMFAVNNGISYGDFAIDSTFIEDSYTLMAWTNYMKNFEEATPFLQKIMIIGSAKQSEKNLKESNTVLMYPEGQQIVANTYNSVGFMIFNEALHPIRTDGIQLVTGNGTQIQSNIQTNELGQGRFGFFVDTNDSYFLKFQDANGLWITKKLEIQQQQGTGISVDNTAKDVVVLIPKLSKSTLNPVDAKQLSMAIYDHINDKFIHRYEFDKNNNPISVDRAQIPKGVNTAVILDDAMRPISQRMFFNNPSWGNRVHSVEVSYCLNKSQDSLQIDLILPKEKGMANLSVSVLTSESEAYYPNNSISSSFLLQPYLEKRLVNGNYFFEGNERSRDYQLDTRLLMEGTEKVNSQLGTKYLNSKTYEFENNIAFNGKILDADTRNEKQVSIFSQTFGSVDIFEVASNKRFKGNLTLFEGDSILVSVLDHRGKLRKPKAELYFNDYSGDTFDYNEWLGNESLLEPKTSQLKIDESLNLEDRLISLDEVVVTERTKQTTKFQITTEIEGRIIDKGTVSRYPSFINYIQKLGFQTRHNYENGGVGVFVYNAPGLAPVPVLVEGMPVNPVQLMSMPLSSVKSIVYNRYVTPHQGPFISLSLRHDYDELYGRDRFMSIAIPKGFSRTQAYFNPNYPDYKSLLYKTYGAIWWERQIDANSDVPYSITVPLNEQQEVRVIVEGMSAQGHLYHTEQICRPFQNK